MWIADYTPDMTAAEAERCWMTPAQATELVLLSREDETKVKRLLNTLSDRQHLPFVKSGLGRTDPRLYSLVSAVMLRVYFDITRDGRTYVYAEPVAQAIAARLLNALSTFETVLDWDMADGASVLRFWGMADTGTPKHTIWRKPGTPEDEELDHCYSVYSLGGLINRVLGRKYPDMWADDLAIPSAGKAAK